VKVTQVSIQPTDAARAAGSPALTPELLAASAARYSRNNEGLESILSRIDPANLDRSVDSIFRMLDYGHQSIADMVPVAMFMDGISIWLAYYVWTLCPTAGGQESSTRYIEISRDALVSPHLLGIPEKLVPQWESGMSQTFSAYRQALDLWETIGELHPELTSIPAEILDDKSEKGCRVAARMSRNYRFDRARCYLPVAAATNMMLVMSARGWAQLCQHLSSHPLPEAQSLADNIRRELELSSPRLMKHAGSTDSIVQGIRSEMDDLAGIAASVLPSELDFSGGASSEKAPDVYLDVSLPDSGAGSAFAGDLKYHDNRYAWVGGTLRRTAVRFRCEAVSMGEIRDLNRHRTGNKYCPLRPLGFYSSLDQLPQISDIATEQVEALRMLNNVGRELSAKAYGLLAAGDPSYIHWTLLGTQYLFEHLTTADKFIYEAELRTGVGSHFRYAKHLKDALGKWYAEFPETDGLIKEGDAEPE
jgi:thymidylate synthase ThyX